MNGSNPRLNVFHFVRELANIVGIIWAGNKPTAAARNATMVFRSNCEVHRANAVLTLDDEFSVAPNAIEYAAGTCQLYLLGNGVDARCVLVCLCASVCVCVM